MNLKTQFTLLIVGIFVIPLLVAAGIIAFQFWSIKNSGYGFSVFPKAMKMIETSSPEDFLNGDFDVLSVPENIELTVIDKTNNTIIFSTQTTSNTSLSQVEHLIARVLANEQEDFSLFNISTDQKQFQYLISYPKIFEGSTNFRPRGYVLALFATLPFIIMLFLAIVFSLLIIKSINNKIRNLEYATTQISSGNLEFEIQSKGSDQFASLAHSLDEMRKQLKDEHVRRSRLLMSISHDLKTPLTSIDGYIDALLEGFGDSESKRDKFLKIMKEKSATLTKRISSLIDFAKLTTSEWNLKLEATSLKDFLEDFIDLHATEAEMQGFEITRKVSISKRIKLPMDEQLIFRALENILSNAMKFSDKRKHIIFSLVQTNEAELQIQIQNYGLGIQKEHSDLVFEPFFRESSGRNEPGTGLGLASAKHIIEAHGWSISASSELGEITSFIICIPRLI